MSRETDFHHAITAVLKNVRVGDLLYRAKTAAGFGIDEVIFVTGATDEYISGLVLGARGHYHGNRYACHMYKTLARA